MTNVSRLEIGDYESAIQLLVTSSDTIWLQSMAMDVNNKDIIYKIDQLIEAGLIELWDYEIKLGKNNRKVEQVITWDEHSESTKYISELILEHSQEIKKRPESEYTIWNIEQRNTLSNQFIAKKCGANSMIQRIGTQENPVIKRGNRVDLHQEYSKYLFNYTNIKSLSKLEIKNILELRKLTKYFREEIQNKIAEFPLDNIPVSHIRKDCEDLSKKYCEIVNETMEHRFSNSGIMNNMALDILSLFSPIVTWGQIGQKLGDLLFEKEQRGFVLYLTRLQKYTR